MQQILFFTPALNVGGLERVMLTYATALAKQEYAVSYAICHDCGMFTSELKRENIDVVNMQSDRLRHSIWRLAKTIRDLNPDYLVTANTATMFAVLAKWLSGRKTKIITFQHSYISDNETNTLQSKYIIKLFFRRCYKVIAVSEGIKRLLVEILRLPASKVSTIYNPIDSERIVTLSSEQTDLPKNYLVFVGRLSPVKNLPYLLKAFAQYLSIEPAMNLMLVGDGIEKNKIDELCRALGVENNVIRVGDKANPYPYIRGARAVLLPSFSEALPTILIESLILGKTVIATPTKGAFEVLRNPELGYIVRSFDDVDELCTAIETALGHPLNPSVLQQESVRYDMAGRVADFKSLLH